MKLSEYLKGTQETTVSIGTRGGGGYLYIGPVSNLPGIANSFAVIYRSAKRELADDKKTLISGRIISDENIDRIQHRIDIRDEYIKTYLPVLKREVLEVYERASEDGIAVIVSGAEYGYWSKEEFESKERTTQARYML